LYHLILVFSPFGIKNSNPRVEKKATMEDEFGVLLNHREHRGHRGLKPCLNVFKSFIKMG
jgi:hypothetical protein